MKQLSMLVLGFLLAFNSLGQSNKLSYRFSYDTLTTTLTVQLQLKGTDSGKTYIQLPDRWASQSAFYKALQYLTVTTKGATLHPTADSSIQYIVHKPNEKLQISYALKQDWSGQLTYPKNYRAVLQKPYIQSTGYALFVLPKKELAERIEVELDWTGFPKNWSIANSLHAKTRKFKGQMALGDFQNTFYTAGDFRLYPINVSGKSVYVAIRGNNWKFQDTALTNKVGNIIQMQRDFWKDHTEPYYFVSLVPFENEGNYNGSALHQSFMLAMSQEFSIDNYTYSLLAHEYFHRWNGIGFSLKAQSNQEDAWFKEGFTEYYTYKLLNRSGIISFTDYVDATNRTIAEYYLSPVRNESQSTLGKNFWKTRDFQQIAYKKGFTYALYIDHLIQTASNGEHSLDNVMLDLHKSHLNKETLTDAFFLDLVKKYSGQDITASHQEYIVLGKTIPVTPESLGSALVGKVKQMGGFDLGFDLNASLKDKKIVGIKEGSEAWKAGLRNGQKLTGHSIYFDRPDLPAEINIEENGTVKTITYLPMAAHKIEVPQFHLKQADH